MNQSSQQDHPSHRRPGQARLWQVALFTVLGNTVFVVVTLALSLLAMVAGWLPPRGDWTYRIARLWARLWLLASGVRIDTHYEQELASERGYIFMANHQSMYDIPALIEGMPGQVRFMAKKGLFQIPIFGWSLRWGGFIPVDRKDRKSARTTFATALARLESGRSILIFPEETRSPDGRLLPLKRGGVVLALKTGFPIVPVAIDGAGEVRPRDTLWIRPGTVRVRYGVPIEVGDYGLSERNELVARVRDDLERLMAEQAS